MAAEICLLRHGETEWNVAGRLQGSLDSPLTPLGREQARRLGAVLARRLGGHRAPRMQTSPLGRAQETAAIVAQQLGSPMNIAVEPRLREITVGSWDGLTKAEVAARFSDRLEGTTRFDWYFRAPDGESYAAARERVRAWLGEQSGPVIAVSHGVTGRLIRGAYLGLGRDDTLSLSAAHDVAWLLRDGRVEALSGDTSG
jgi:probable phosphoglycerate mutase